MEEKSLNNLEKEILSLFDKDKGHIPSEKNLQDFSISIIENLRNLFEKGKQQTDAEKGFRLRMSKIGLPARKLWFESRADPIPPSPALTLRFLYGDIVESLLLFLVKEAGYSVTGEQGEVEIENVKGHRDCKINGVTVDIKSASSFSFSKFKKGAIHQDDPFGYIAQISAYCFADKSPYGGFLVMNKESGEIVFSKVEPVDMIHPPTRINNLKEVIKKEEPPIEKCYPPKALGVSGNMVLNKNCAYCPFKHTCWKDANNGKGLRSFSYSNGVKHFVTIASLPSVEEIT